MIRIEPFFCFRQTFKACLTNLACAPFFLLAVLFYAFYYCWPYMAQLPEHLDAVIVDGDNSPLSRRLCQALAASPDYRITSIFQNRPLAERQMKENMISAIIGVPPNFEKDILTGVPTAINLLANGAFIVKAKDSLNGSKEVLEKLASEALTMELLERGVKINPAVKKSPALVIQYMYNTIAGYLSFAVSIVFVIIFQSIMLCGFSMLLNDWFSRKNYPAPLRMALNSPICLLAMQAPVFLICIFWIYFVEGFAFAWQGINSFQNISATFAVSLLFAWALTALGLLTGLSFNKSKFAIHAIICSSLPCVFISGNLFPWQDIPLPLRAFASLLPSTPGVDAMLRASQAGANISEIYLYLIHLFLLGLLYFISAWLLSIHMRKSLN